MSRTPLPSPERLKEVLRYDSATGYFVWTKTRNNNAKCGQRAGSRNRKYWYIEIDGRSIGAHRIAWAMVYGDWPSYEVDHINTDPLDNRIENLRLVSREQNMGNQRKAHRNSRTGVLGVSVYRGRFKAVIQAQGRTHHLGTYDTIDEASAAYVAAKARLHGVVISDGQVSA